MKEIRVIDGLKVRQLCIKENFYTCGTNEEYSNLLCNLCVDDKGITLEDIEVIAVDILSHSLWKEKAINYGVDYDEMLLFLMENLINECCYTFVTKDNKAE